MNLVAPIEQQVVAAYKATELAGQDYALKALICGQLLWEMREQLRVSHSGTSSLKGRNQHSADDGFYARCEALNIPKSNAYRYAQAAERVARAQLGLRIDAPLKPVIEIGNGETMSLSQALTLPENKLPASARGFRQGVFDFMADHTLGEAARAVFDGESDAKRITLASGGKTKGGKGSGDRKAFEKFTAQKLKHLTTFFGQKLNTNQKGLIIAAFNTAMELWPRWLLEALADKCKSELKLSDHDRASRLKLEGDK